MQASSLAHALEREHQQIDAGIAAFTADPADQRPLARAIAALRRHIYLEEEFLFPLLREAQPALAAPVFVMLREHAQIWDLLDTLEHAASADPGPGPALHKQLTVHLLHHNLKEEQILYPQADRLLAPAAADKLQALLDSGRIPDGWVCARARKA